MNNPACNTEAKEQHDIDGETPQHLPEEGWPTEDEGPDEIPPEDIPTPESRVEELLAQNNELNDRLLRTLADFENFKKRSRQQMEERGKYANEKLVADLLPIIDNFERALDSQHENGDLQSWKSGVELIARQLADVLQRYGVYPIESVNTEFDPNRHEAVGHLIRDDLPEGKIAEEVQKGYLLHDRLLRPARVRVVLRPPAGESTGAEDHASTEHSNNDPS